MRLPAFVCFHEKTYSSISTSRIYVGLQYISTTLSLQSTLATSLFNLPKQLEGRKLEIPGLHKPTIAPTPPPPPSTPPHYPPPQQWKSGSTPTNKPGPPPSSKSKTSSPSTSPSQKYPTSPSNTSAAPQSPTS